jgi:uncharacterized protein
MKSLMRSIALTLFIWILCGCSHVFYQPSKQHYLDPAQFKLAYQDIFFQAADGTQLHGWFFPSTKKSKGTIVHFHGNAQNLSTHFLSLVWIIDEGYNLFVFDYRGYGKSDGKPNQKGVNKDALAALTQGRELHLAQGGGKFVVFGQSLGGIISLRALADYKYLDEVDLIVQDSTFSSYKRIAFDRLKSHWFLIPLSPLAFVTVSDEYASYKIFEKIKRPLLVMAGSQDHIIPAKFGKEIYQGIDAKKWWWLLENGTHIGVFHHQLVPYRQKFLQLLDELSQN